MALEDFLTNSIHKEDSYKYTLVDILQLRAKFTPENIAFIYLLDGEYEEVEISYAALDQKASQIARSLIDLKMQGKRALMLYPPGPEFITAYFGCLYAGTIAVPAYPPRKNNLQGRIQAIIVDSAAKVILTTKKINDSIDRNFENISSLQDMKWLATDELDYHVSEVKTERITPDTLAMLQYTSGSTGSPKGVMVNHQNLMRNMEFLRQCFELSSETKVVHWLPVFHDMGLVFGVLEPVYSGYTGILMPPVSFIHKPVRWLKAISRFGAVLGGAPNFAYDLCVSKTSDEDCEGLDLTRLRTLYNGAEPIRKDTLDRFVKKFKPWGFHDEDFYPTYGMAEATLILAGGKVDEKPVCLYVDKDALKKNSIKVKNEEDNNASYQVSVGRTWIDTKIIIVDPESFEQCNEDEIGEIWVAGSIVALGYLNKPEETERTFNARLANTDEGPFLRTGDLGFYHNENLFVSGRLKDLIIIRGRNYYPHDIEFIIEKSHEAIRSECSAAFSVDIHDEERLVVVAEVERTFLRDLDIESVCDKIRQAVYEEFEIEVFEIQLLRTASILKTSSGKIQRQACRAAYLNDTLNVVGSSKLPDSSPEAAISGIDSTESVLKWLKTWISFKFRVEYNSIDENRSIISYGLNSMKAVELQQHFLDTYKIDFPPYLFFEKSSVKELAEKAYQLIVGEDA